MTGDNVCGSRTAELRAWSAGSLLEHRHGVCISACSGAQRLAGCAWRGVAKCSCDGCRLKLVPHGTLGAAAAGMLSTDGRCKTLDARANGYARSEGVGALTLCTATALGVMLGGSAVRQDGRSASLTAPNGSAQRTLLLAAYGRAAVAADEIGCAEAHGTGTGLGDPTEAGALAAVHGTDRCSTPLAVGAAKGSVGHSEAASGQVGLLKMQRLLACETVPGNPQLRVLNPLVGARLADASEHFAIGSQGVSASSSIGCVSSFGFSGTIAHAVCNAGQTCARHRRGSRRRRWCISAVHSDGEMWWRCRRAQRRLQLTTCAGSRRRRPALTRAGCHLSRFCVSAAVLSWLAAANGLARAETGALLARGGIGSCRVGLRIGICRWRSGSTRSRAAAGCALELTSAADAHVWLAGACSGCGGRRSAWRCVGCGTRAAP